MRCNYLLIVQARQNSSRFPNKVLRDLNGTPVINFLLKRLSKCKLVDNIVVAIPKNKENNKLKNLLKNNKHIFFEGSESNVLKRFYYCAKYFSAKNIIRITADCPFSDPCMIDNFIKIFEKKKVDYLSNGNPPTYPDGYDIEIFKFKALKKAFLEAKTLFEKEHVTPYIKNSKSFKKFNVISKDDQSKYRLTIDYSNDLIVIKKIINKLKDKIFFTYDDILNAIKKNNKIMKINLNIKRNIGSQIDINEKIWLRAKKVIPGGNMLVSKRPELFLPRYWPTYFKKSSGIKIWSLQNKVYKDFSSMGIGTNILGYANKQVDDAVKNIVANGNMSTLNSYEDILLAEKLVEIHPWADMAKFARSGGEANSIAIRIARASSGKDKVAICGYHGWHDWYLSANLKSKDKLNNHLMTDLEPKGVPKNLKNTVFAFEYNNIESLKRILNDHDIGTIKMEVKREEEPKNKFLYEVRKLANEKKIILIFDECTSGFRQAFGGLHKYYKVNPDMAMFGKALGNGYAITAVIGRRSVMEAANQNFISSTMWTERIGTAAALKTLDIMEKNKTWEKISHTGAWLKEQWKNLAKIYDINIKIQGLNAIPNFIFQSTNHQAYKTLITQELLKKNILATNKIFISILHSKKDLKIYLYELEKVFKKIKKIEDGEGINNYLYSPSSYNPFLK